MEAILAGILEEVAKSEIQALLQKMLQGMMGIIVLVSIPFLVFAVAYCFFGIKFLRVLLVISGIFGGGMIGAFLIGIGTSSGGGAVVGFLIIGAIGGLLAWFVYKVFLAIEAFFTGFIGTSVLLFVLTENISVSLSIGLIVGMALGVLICIYARLFVMIMTVYKGASTIASILSLLFITSGSYKIIYVLLIEIFTAAGLFVQYKYGGSVSIDMYKSEKDGKRKGKGSKYMLVGIDGMYKGFEFDLDDEIVFGRDEESCNVIFPNTCAGISRIQCQIAYDRRTRSVSIVDKFSSYGTTLNGKRLEINELMPLTEGDVVMFGENNVFKLTGK